MNLMSGVHGQVHGADVTKNRLLPINECGAPLQGPWSHCVS